MTFLTTRTKAAIFVEKTAMSSVARKILFTLLDLYVSSLRRGHAILLCIVPSLTQVAIFRNISSIFLRRSPAKDALERVADGGGKHVGS